MCTASKYAGSDAPPEDTTSEPSCFHFWRQGVDHINAVMIEGGINDAILHVELFNIVLCQRFDTRIADFAGFELNIDHDVIVAKHGERLAQ